MYRGLEIVMVSGKVKHGNVIEIIHTLYEVGIMMKYLVQRVLCYA